jgi:predicted transcriptional regulator
MRTLIDIPSEQIQSLAELSSRSRRPRAALIREAIAEYLANHRPAAGDAFGLWGKAAPDGLKYQKKLRAEW